VLLASGPDDQVVVVDDGSQDSPKAACPKDGRITWLEQGPLGIAAALETGRRECIHPYIARMDIDDLTLPGRVEVQTAILDDCPNVAVVGGRAEIFREDGVSNEGMRRYVDWVNGLENLHAALLVESPIFHPAVMMRAESIAAVGGYRAGDFPEDYDLWLRLVQAGFKLAAVPNTVVRIRDRPGRLTRTDARYRMAAFEGLKRDWLQANVLKKTRRVVVWGAGKSGRRWLRWLLAEGYDVVAVIDDFVGTERQGIPVFRPSALSSLELECLFVAVGARGARSTIRGQLHGLRPDLIEGVNWWALA